MPWDISKRGEKWCVVKEGESKPVPGGCHATRAQAIKHQRALYASEETTDSMELADDRWEGVLGIEHHPTADGRLLLKEEIFERDLPLPIMVQTMTDEGHDSAVLAGRIEKVEHIPVEDFDLKEEFNLLELTEGAVVLWGEGSFAEDTEGADEAKRMIENGAGISLDLPPDRVALLDPETFEELDEDEIDLMDLMFGGDFLMGIGGKIAGATIVTVPAFEEASIRVAGAKALVASAYGLRVVPALPPAVATLTVAIDGTVLLDGAAMTAAAGPMKPPSEWFEDPRLVELTPLTITNDGRVYGHLADWDGCHTGFQGICVPPFRSYSDYAYFNVGEIETIEGDLIPCGKIMFSQEENIGHASTDPDFNWEDAWDHYDKATKVGAFVRAGSDRFGTWIAGALRPGLTDEEVQHLRTHPPSGDWRPIPGKGTELVAAFAVPIPGFPIARHALVASANGEISAIISAPLHVTADLGARRRRRQRALLSSRLHAALVDRPTPRAKMRREAMAASGDDAA